MRYAKLALVLLLCLLCVGCRSRTIDGRQNPEMQETDAQGTFSPEIPGSESEPAADSDDVPAGSEPADGVFAEDPNASRRGFDEHGQGEIVPETERSLHTAGDGDASPIADETAANTVTATDEQAEQTATQTVAAQEAEQMGVSEDADEAESAMVYYTVLLQDRLRSLFECQRLNLYWETVGDHVTIYKTAPEHELILNAGCYDVSARLLEANLQVDDGWVARKNPGIIVRVVDASVLGSSVYSTAAAQNMANTMLQRENWAGIDAVRNKRIILLSEEVLSVPYLQLFAMNLIAKTAYPTLFADVETAQML